MISQDSAGYYKLLELSPQASDEEIKLSYRRLAKKWHPDSNKSSGAMEMFQKLSVAHDILSDPSKRLTYDLACMAHGSDNFPDIFALKIYPNRHGAEDIGVRSLRQQVISGFLHKSREEQHWICNYAEALRASFLASVRNWTLGWWSWRSILKVPSVLRYNYRHVNNAADNLAVLVHNALAYQQEHKYSEAYVCASQAWNYAAPYQKELLEKFLKSLPDVKTLPQPYWNYRRLQQVQLIVPSLLLAAILGFSVIGGMRIFHPAASDELSYYQEVQHWRGGRGVDDVVVAKIMDIRVDLNSFNMLYHISPTTGVEVMYGPSDKFDVLTTLSQGHTVRVTGISPDKVWMRIMLDNGDMGFVHSADLVEGIGSPIPVNSQIYTGAR